MACEDVGSGPYRVLRRLAPRVMFTLASHVALWN